MAKIIAPVVTIFNEEEKPDYAGNKKVIDFLIEGGLDGILVLGSAGEFPDLNEQERLDFFRFYAEYVNGRVELLAGTGCIRYADTLALSNACLLYTSPFLRRFPFFHRLLTRSALSAILIFSWRSFGIRRAEWEETC